MLDEKEKQRLHELALKTYREIQKRRERKQRELDLCFKERIVNTAIKAMKERYRYKNR